jgi:cell division septum initiation protein DivIVA
MIQFNLDHTTQLRNSIASFQAIYREEWLDLIQRLQDLQQVWNDTHRLEFEQDFQNLTTTHQQIDQDLEHHLQELDRVFSVIQSMQENLPHLSETTQSISTQVTSAQNHSPSTPVTSQPKATAENTESTLINQVINQYDQSADFLISITKKGGKSLMTGLTILTLINSGLNTLMGNILDAERSLRGPETSHQSKDAAKKGSYRWVLDKLFAIEKENPMGENFGDWADEGAEQMKKKQEMDEAAEKESEYRRKSKPYS